jgi:hypothetical protein
MRKAKFKPGDKVHHTGATGKKSEFIVVEVLEGTHIYYKCFCYLAHDDYFFSLRRRSGSPLHRVSQFSEEVLDETQ